MWQLWNSVLFGAKWGLQSGRHFLKIALRNGSKAAVGEGQYIRLWWRGSSVQSSTYFTKGFLLGMRNGCHHEGIQCFSRYEEMQGLGSWNQFLKISNYLKTCSTSFIGAQSTSLSTLNSLHGAWKVSSFSNTGRWQMPFFLFCCCCCC